MKKIRLLLIIGLLALTTTLTSCNIVPHRFSWVINYAYKDITYVNGNTLRTTIRQGIDLWNMNGIHSQMTYIDFDEDGSVIFKPLDSNELKGTYKCKNNRLKNTNIFIKLENGDKIEALGAGGYFEDTLSFEYNGIEYEFSSRSVEDFCDDQEEFNEQLKYLGEYIRSFEEYKRNYIEMGEVVVENGIKKLVHEDGEIDLFAENLGVNAVRVTVDNEVIFLDSIEEGECYYYNADYRSDENSGFLTLLYLDPLPKDPEEPTQPDNQTPEETKTNPFLKIVPELEYYYSNPDNTLLKFTKIHSPALIYNFDETVYVSEPDDIIFWLNSFFYDDAILVESEQPQDIGKYHLKYGIEISDKTNEHSIIIAHFECNMFYFDGKWYSCSKSPSWTSALAVASFNCNNSIVTNKDNQEVTFDVKGLEFIRDRNKDFNYSDVLNPIILTGEFGEITVYDRTHFYFKDKYYIVTSEKDFSSLFSN